MLINTFSGYLQPQVLRASDTVFIFNPNGIHNSRLRIKPLE